MNKVLQGVLVLDTDTSRILKKGGKVSVPLNGITVNITLDEERELKFTTEERTQFVVVEEYKDNVIYMKSKQLEAVKNGTPQEISNGILVYDKEQDKFILKPKHTDKITLVLYR